MLAGINNVVMHILGVITFWDSVPELTLKMSPLRICLLMQGMQVQPLVQELRSHTPWDNYTVCPNY